MRDRYYDRSGAPMSREDWAKCYEGDTAERIARKRVAETTLPDGKWISTVWLGLDHNFGIAGRPLIFETMVFPAGGSRNELDCERYSTEEEARQGHEAMVAKWAQPRVEETP